MSFKKMLFLFVICSVFSCSNEGDDLASNVEKQDYPAKESSEEANFKFITDFLSGIVHDDDIVKEVKAGVETSLLYGLDEELRFREILKSDDNKLRSASKSLLAEKLEEAFGNIGKTKSATEALNGDELETFVLNDNVQIYWPYSERWDGKEIPFVTYAPTDKDADDVTDVMAYRKIVNPDGTSRIESRMVNEAYAKEHPVWIINKNEMDYEELPDFKAGEFEKNGRLFVSDLLPDARNNKTLRARTPLVVFYLGKLTVTTQHDSWIAGGSEFEFTNAQPLAPGYTTTGNTKVWSNWSRGQISDGITKGIWQVLNMDWTVEQVQNGLKVVETDDGKSTAWKLDLGVKLANDKGLGFTVSASIPFNNNDDEIYEKILMRSYMTDSESNPATALHGGRGVKWTMYTEAK
ncbi:MAG: hypothetical protein LBF62_05390 [Tannerellaceae bacterium]|jgi:hypothetical protein|nr:hypothetical protein [Tannerellaceae bacterium]